MRLIDADAYSAEMKDRQDAAYKWKEEAISEGDEVKQARAEGAYTAFTEAKLTMDKHIINPWHRVEEPPKQNGAYVVWWNYKGTSYWFRGVFFNGRWLFEPGTPKPDYWMPIEPPQEVQDV